MSITDICSYCGKNGLECHCENFHPSIPSEFILSDFEIKALLDYFMNRAGYISREFDNEVHKIIRRLNDYDKQI